MNILKRPERLWVSQALQSLSEGNSSISKPLKLFFRPSQSISSHIKETSFWSQRNGLNSLNESPMKYLTLKAAAKHTGVSKSKIWRSVNEGLLIANKGRTSGGQEAWLVGLDDLERWAENALNNSDTVIEDVVEDFEEVEVLQEDQSDSEYFEAFHGSDSESFRPNQGPPLELYMALVDKVAMSERRSVELELELRKYRLLLTENAESIVEREARLKEIEARKQSAETALKEREAELGQTRVKAELAAGEVKETKLEAERVKQELDLLKTEMAAKEAQWAERRRPWYKKLFAKTS